MKVQIKEGQEDVSLESLQVEIKESKEVVQTYTISKLDAIISNHEKQIVSLGDELASFKEKRELVLEELEKAKVNK